MTRDPSRTFETQGWRLNLERPDVEPSLTCSPPFDQPHNLDARKRHRLLLEPWWIEKDCGRQRLKESRSKRVAFLELDGKTVIVRMRVDRTWVDWGVQREGWISRAEQKDYKGDYCIEIAMKDWRVVNRVKWRKDDETFDKIKCNIDGPPLTSAAKHQDVLVDVDHAMIRGCRYVKVSIWGQKLVFEHVDEETWGK